MGAILLAAAVPLFAARFVLEPVQILWINLLEFVLLTMPLMMEPMNRACCDSRRGSPTRIINALFMQRVVVMGLAIAAPGFLLYYYPGAGRGGQRRNRR